jgi:hypothetical protein
MVYETPKYGLIILPSFKKPSRIGLSTLTGIANPILSAPLVVA